MAKNSSTFSFKEMAKWLPKAFVVFLLFMIPTEILIYKCFSKHSTNETHIKMREKIRAAQDKGNRADILIVGDSSAGAINAHEMERQTGLKGFNLALFGDATLAGNYLMLKEYLKNKKPPKAIVMMNVYNIWNREINDPQTMRVFLMNYPKIFFEATGFKSFSPNLFENLLPSQRYKYEIRRFLRNPAGFLKESLARSEEVRKVIYDRRGSALYEAVGKEIIDSGVKVHEQFVFEDAFEATDWNRYFLEKFFKITKENNIKVYVFYAPLYKKLYDKINQTSHLLAYKDFMVNIVNLYDHVSLLSDNFYLAEEDQLASVDHLIASEALVFTRKISKEIAQKSL